MRNKVKVIAAAAVIGLVGAGGAFAYWAFNGAGSGFAQTAASPTLGVVVSQTATGYLAPGESVALAGLLTNPNKTDIKVGTLTAAISVPSDVAASDFSITGNDQVIEKVVKSTTPVAWSGMTLVYANSAVSQDKAKDVKVTLTYTLTPSGVPVLGALARTGTDTVLIYIHTLTVSGNGATYTILPGDTLKLQSNNSQTGADGIGNSAVLATADSAGNILYAGPTTFTGGTVTVKVFHGSTMYGSPYAL